MAVEAPGAYLPLSLLVDGVPRAEYYITTHSYARARVLESRVGPEGGREGVWASAPCSYYTSLKSCHPLRLCRRNLQPFSHVSERGLIVPVENRGNEFYEPPRTVPGGRTEDSRNLTAIPAIPWPQRGVVRAGRINISRLLQTHGSVNWLDNGCLIFHV